MYQEFAHVYDQLITKEIDYRRWAQAILKIFRENRGGHYGSYLDLACGTGSLTVEVGKAFKEVWAIDLSQDMLAEAEQKLRAAGIKAQLYCQNLNALELPQRFDLITCSLDATNYLLTDEELSAYFQEVKRLLKDEGLFIFDVNSYYKLRYVQGDAVFSFDDDDVVCIMDNEFDQELNISNMYLTFFIKEDGVYHRYDEEHRERAYTDEEIRCHLAEAGLEVVQTLDEYDREEISPETERIVYVVRKRCSSNTVQVQLVDRYSRE